MATTSTEPPNPQPWPSRKTRLASRTAASRWLVVIIRTARRIGSRGWAWALGLLLGGSLGNLTDRMVREPGPGRGHVVDFIDYFGLFIGNVADIAIVGAAVLIGLLALRGIGVDGKHPHHGRHEAAE